MFQKGIDIYRKIRKHGVLTTCKIITDKLYSFWLRLGLWPIKVRFYYNLMKLIFAPNFQKKRILGVWDFKALPWSVGDPLLFIERLSILKIKYNAEEVDICVIYDSDNPIGNRKKAEDNNITSDNAQDYMLEFLPLFSTCPYLGSIFQFNSRKEFYHFLKSNVERYDMFPPLAHHLGETYNYADYGFPNFNEVQDFYNSHGYIPYLRIGDRDGFWAHWFYLNYLPENTVPVTLSLKQTSHASERNTNPVVWLSFIDQCKIDFPEVVFVFVGLREETFDGLRKRSNVIIAKDFGTSIIEDLALIRTSLMYMGTSSGVNTIAQFSDLPYLIFKFPEWCLHRLELKSGENFSFATGRQKMFSTQILVTPELLLNEFKALYSKLDRNKWCSTVLEKARNKYGHPSARVKMNSKN